VCPAGTRRGHTTYPTTTRHHIQGPVSPTPGELPCPESCALGVNTVERLLHKHSRRVAARVRSRRCGYRRSARTTAGYRRPRSRSDASSPDGRGPPGSDRFWATTRHSNVSGVDHRPRPVQFPGTVQLRQQQLVQLFPDPGSVPHLEASPAGHPRPESQLLREELPLDTGVQHEQDPAQHLPIRDPLPTRIRRIPRRRLGQQRLDALPQPVRHDPRRLLTTPYGRTS
jgi:hypothetical protein